MKRNKELYKHLFYASNGLGEKEIVLSCNIDVEQKYLDAMWQNDYCGLLWTDSIPDFIVEAYERTDF